MISREEAAAHPRLAQSFDRLDANQDGALSREELRAGHRSGHHGRRASLDTNGDGSISRDEATTAPHLAEKFDSIDADKNGALTRDELAAWRKSHPRPSAGAPAEPIKTVNSPPVGRQGTPSSHAVPAHERKPGPRGDRTKNPLVAPVARLGRRLGPEGCPGSVGGGEVRQHSGSLAGGRGFPARGSCGVRRSLNLCPLSPSNVL